MHRVSLSVTVTLYLNLRLMFFRQFTATMLSTYFFIILFWYRLTLPFDAPPVPGVISIVNLIKPDNNNNNNNNNTCLTAFCPRLPGWAGIRRAKPIWILLKQETVSGSGINWAICKSAPHSRQITMPAPHHSAFYRPDALSATQLTASKHWRYLYCYYWQDSDVDNSGTWHTQHQAPSCKHSTARARSSIITSQRKQQLKNNAAKYPSSHFCSAVCLKMSRIHCSGTFCSLRERYCTR